jgi:hypothetical protein
MTEKRWLEPETWRFTPSTARDVRGPVKGDVPAPAPLEPAQDSTFTLIPPSRGELTLPRAGQQRHYSLRAEAGGPRQKRLRS